MFDLVLVANVLWPLLIWLGTVDGFTGRDGLLFWQVYFVITPHRWITLMLVFGDRQRFRSRRWLFVGIATAVVAVTLGVRIGTGSLTCLLTVDYPFCRRKAGDLRGAERAYSELMRAAPSGQRALLLAYFYEDTQKTSAALRWIHEALDQPFRMFPRLPPKQ